MARIWLILHFVVYNYLSLFFHPEPDPPFRLQILITKPFLISCKKLIVVNFTDKKETLPTSAGKAEAGAVCSIAFRDDAVLSITVWKTLQSLPCLWLP